MSKRKRFLVTSAVLSLGFIGIQFLDNQYRFWAIGSLGLLTLITFVWSLFEGLGLNATLFSLILPVSFTISVGIFWFLLPSSLFARLPIIIFYGLGIYVLNLTMNIYTVAAIRTIALLRAARGVGFVLTLITSFLIFDAVLSLRSPLYVSTLSSGILSFPLFLQGFWAIELDKGVTRRALMMSIIGSLVLVEVSLLLFFWPVSVVVGSLFLTVSVYMLLGLGQAYLEERFFVQTVREYLIVGVLVFIGMFFATVWGN